MKIAGGIQPNVAVTIEIKVLHNICNMHTHDLPDIYSLSLWFQAYISVTSYQFVWEDPIIFLSYNLGRCYQQISYAHVTTFGNFMQIKLNNVALYYLNRL